MVADYFAELYVAGLLADAGWNIYFPHRDKGFDFIARKQIDGQELLRPVQVKGKYPTDVKSDKAVYGYVGRLTMTHAEMVLAIPYFTSTRSAAPSTVAYMPFSEIRPHKRGYRCEPATYTNGKPRPRPKFKSYFDETGILALAKLDWKDLGHGA